MQQIFATPIILLVALAGYLLSYQQFKKNKTKVALLLLCLSGLLLRLFTAADPYLHDWDERFHALVAKNMMDEPFLPKLYDTALLPYDFKNWASNHIWVHKQPLPLWCIAWSMKLFGANEWSLRLPSVLLSTLGILLTFDIAKRLFDTKVAFFAAFLYSIHGLIIEVSAGRVATDHIDVFFLFFVELAVFFVLHFAQKKALLYNVFCGMSIAAAILSKWLPALIVLPIWCLAVWKNRRCSLAFMLLHFMLLLLIVLLLVLPWQWYIFHYFPAEAQWESAFNVKHITEELDKNGGAFYYHFNKMRILFGELIYLPLIWLLYVTIKKRNNYTYLLLSIWILIPFVFFSIAKTKMQGYTLFTAPAIFIMTALFARYMLRFFYHHRGYRGVYLIVMLLWLLPLRYSIERIKPLKRENPEWAQELQELQQLLSTSANNKVAIFNAERPIETMFYTPAIAYAQLPDSSVLSQIQQQNYRVYIRNKNCNNLNGNDLYTAKLKTCYCLYQKN